MNKPKRKIATRFESMKRVHQIYQWLSQGLPNLTIYDKCAQLYKIKQSQTDKLISRARFLLQKRFNEESHGQLPDILRKLDAIHKKTFEGELTVKDGIKITVPDHSVARQALMDKAKLLGLLTNKIDMTVNDEREHADSDDTELEAAVYTSH